MSKYFTSHELSCKCGCGMTVTNEEFLERLDNARALSGIPYIVTSGARCVEHNKKVGGVTTSSHTKGLAVDIAYQDSNKCYKILKGLMFAGFKRIGINFNKQFIHVDVDKDKTQDVVFKY